MVFEPSTVILAAVMAVLILGVIRAIMMNKNETKELVKQTKSVADMQLAEADLQNLRDSSDKGLEYLITYFVRNISTKSIKTSYSNRCATDRIWHLLQEFADSFELINRTDDQEYVNFDGAKRPNRTETYLFEKGSTTFMVAIQSSAVSEIEIDRVATAARFDVQAHLETDNSSGKEYLMMSRQIRLVCPADDVDSAEVKHSTIKQMIEESELEFKAIQVNFHAKIYSVMLEYDRLHSRPMRLTEQECILSEDRLKTQYMPVTFNVNGKHVSVPMDKLAGYIGASIERGANFSFGELPGTGKSTLLRHLAFEAAKNENNKVFFFDSSDLELFRDPKSRTQLTELFDKKKRNVIVLDQAETLLASNDSLAKLFLDMIDGTLSKEYNTSFMVAYNGQIGTFNNAFFRQGRLMDIDLQPLDSHQLKALRKDIEENLEEGMMFNEEYFNNTLKAVNTDNQGNVYAKPGFMVLSDVYAAVQRQDSQDILTGLIIQKEPVAEAPVVTPKSKKTARNRRRKK